MGYSHKWQRPAEIDRATFAAIARDVLRMMPQLPKESHSAGGYYIDTPLHIGNDWGDVDGPDIDIEAGMLAFNGWTAQGMDADAFEFDRVMDEEDRIQPTEDGSAYTMHCKTERKPYDLLVCATLLAIKHHCPAVYITTDGNAQDWQAAIRFYRKVFPTRVVPAFDGIHCYDGTAITKRTY